MDDALKYVQESFPSLGSSTTEMERVSSWSNSNIRLTPSKSQTMLLSKNDGSPDNKASSSAAEAAPAAPRGVSWKDMKQEQTCLSNNKSKDKNDSTSNKDDGATLLHDKKNKKQLYQNDVVVDEASGSRSKNDLSVANNEDDGNIDLLLEHFFDEKVTTSTTHKSKDKVVQDKKSHETKKKHDKTIGKNIKAAGKEKKDDSSSSSESEDTEESEGDMTKSINDDGASEGTSTIIDDINTYNKNKKSGVSNSKIKKDITGSSKKNINNNKDNDDETVGFFDDMYYAWGDCCAAMWIGIKNYATEMKNDCIHEVYMSAADIVDNSTCSPTSLRQQASKYANDASSVLDCTYGTSKDHNNNDDDTYTAGGSTIEDEESLLLSKHNDEINSKNTDIMLSQEKKSKIRSNMKPINVKEKRYKGGDPFLSVDSDESSSSSYTLDDTLDDTLTERDEPSYRYSKNKAKQKKTKKKEDNINELQSNLRELQQNMKDVIHETSVLQQMVALQGDVVGISNKGTTTTTPRTRSVVKSREGLGKKNRGDYNNTTNNSTTSSTNKHTTTTITGKQQKEHSTTNNNNMKRTTSAFTSKKKVKGSSNHKKNKE